MLQGRRVLLKGLAGSLGFVAAAHLADGQAPHPMPSPNAPSNQNVPAGMNGPEIIHPDKAPPSPVIQQQIDGYVQQLFKLATELKDEVEHTNMNTTFSLAFVKKAQQIEKLAKQIKDRAKG